MIHYFAALAGLASILLLLAAWAGLEGWPRHLELGLAAAIASGAAHSLLILFSLVAARVLREAVRARNLTADLLQDLNRFFAEKSAYPAALLAVLVTAAAAVLGFANRGFDLDPAVHMVAGLLAVVVNLWTFSVEARAVLYNQRVLDRAAAQLDALDRVARESGVEPEEEPPPALDLQRIGWTLLFGSWLPYLYQVLILWKGDFGRVSMHPWIEGSLLGLGVLLLAVRGARASATE